MVELPKSIRVGYKDYAVEDWDPKLATASGRLGECDHLAATIRVNTSYGSVQAAETLMHETIHAAWYVGQVAASDPEERVVGILGCQLTQIVRDNPDFLAFMSASLAAPEVEGPPA